ncbi:hypothetical protein H9L39_19213 [Fusarium oxysporum f. sp. albedinis]|nr:hypothetical protein H9L39_19213 [Fusarium oxysporum f. sp. albedinis]
MPSHKTSVGKRFAAPPARSACTSCRASRVRCSGGIPCGRCISKSQTCIFTPSRRGQRPRSRNKGRPGTTSTHPVDNSINTSGVDVISIPLTQLDPSPLNDLTGGSLPPLYGDNLEDFCFDDIFGGPSDDALESFFTDIFTIPSFPRARTADGLVLGSLQSERPIIRGYGSDDDVIRAYYELIHPAFPILPPPVEDSPENTNHVSEPWAPKGQLFPDYEPSSPLILSLLSVLTLLPHANNEQALEKDSRECRATFAQALAQSAVEAIEIGAPPNQPTGSFLSPSAYHPNVPTKLEAPLAYCVLSLYQYLHRGDMAEMVHLANEAYDACVHLSLHQFNEDGSIFAEAVRRTWWMTYVSICFSATITCKPPTRSTDLSKFTTPYPTTGVTSTASYWVQYIRAEETLVAATLLLVALVRGFDSAAATPAFRQSLSFMNTVIENQLSCLSTLDHLEPSANISSEDRLIQSLKAMTLIRLMRFEAVPSWRPPHAIRQPVSTRANVEDKNQVAQVFPFTCKDSLDICIDSALGVADCLASLRKDLHIAPFACSALLAGYTLMMISFFQTYSPEEGICAISASELQARCKYGVNASIDALEHFAVGFDFIKILNDQVQTAAIACEMR